MVDQAKIGGRASDGPNGAKSAPRAVAHNMAELAHDALTLGELQYELLRCDINQALGRVVVPLALLVGSGVLLLSCVPLALAVVGLFIAQYTDLSYALAFLITLAGGLIIGGLIALIGVWYLRHSFDVLARSKNEFQQNVRWVKTMFKRLGSSQGRHYVADYKDADNAAASRYETS